MPAIKYIVPSRQFADVTYESKAMGEKNDCVTRAIVLLTGLPYKQVNDALLAEGRKPRSGTHWVVAQRALKSLGFKVEALTDDEVRAIIQSYPGAHKNLQHITTRHPIRFRKQWGLIEPLMFDLNGHVAAFKAGELHDWTQNKAMRVRELIRIVPLTTDHAAQPAPDRRIMDEPETDEPAGAHGHEWALDYFNLTPALRAKKENECG